MSHMAIVTDDAEAPTKPTPLCQQMDDPDTWWGDPGTEASKVAKTICQECPVRYQCLIVGVTNNEPWGIWGGKDNAERRRWAKRNPVPSLSRLKRERGQTT